MTSPTDEEIAGNFSLWAEYIDPRGEMDEAEFNTMTVEERVALIRSTFRN